MERFKLSTIYGELSDFKSAIGIYLSAEGDLAFGLNTTQLSEVSNFVVTAVWGYFYNDLVAYPMEDEGQDEIFLQRLAYDIMSKIGYWYRKYSYIKKLLTDADLSLFQTSKMTSSSSDTTKTAGGSLQKVATTPTGVSADSSTDSIDITIGSGTSDGENEVDTTGFVDKYTNTQQKYANANRVEGSREGEILREGSIDDVLNVLEKLPSSFADEVTKALQKHFIFDYDGEEKEYYDEL